MNKRLLTLVTAALMMTFAGAAMADQASGDPGATATTAVAANQAGMHSAGDIPVSKHVNAHGEQVLCIAEADFAKILNWYNTETSRRAKHARIMAELEELVVEP